jgi:hypothetical protein
MDQEHRVTLDHAEIRSWVEQNGGHPQVLDDPSAGSDRIGIRIDFPGPQDEQFLAESSNARDIGWDEFFDLFERLGWVFVYRQEIDVQDRSSSYHFEPRPSQ